MVATPAKPYRSANAGEFSRDASGRIDIKQYYSAGLAFKNVEPVPQSGFRQMGGTWKAGNWRAPLSPAAIGAPTLAAMPVSGVLALVWSGTLASPVLAAVIVTNFAISAGAASFIVEAQTAPGVWTLMGAGFLVATGTPVTRIAAFAPTKGRVATAIRIRASFTTAATVTIGGVTAATEAATVPLKPRLADLTTPAGDTLVVAVTAGIADFWTDAGYQGCAFLGNVVEAMLPDLDFYCEGDTIGIFHGTLETARLTLMQPGGLHDWRADLWPYDTPLPVADLGGVYAKTDDVWTISFRWTGATELWVVMTVDGETTPAVPHVDSLGNVLAQPNFTQATFDIFAADMQAALEALPGVGTGVSVVAILGDPVSGFYTMTVTFGGALSGREFDFQSTINNTSDASALAYHTNFGKTDFEALFSTARGWPGFVDLVQDRLGYARIPAVSGALALSRIAEYFDVNAAAVTDDAARLDRLRSKTSETIVAFKESKYLLVLTDKGVYFATNRTIERNQPLNFVNASEIGAQPNCRPFDLEGVAYYVAINPQGLAFASEGGKQLVSTVYDDVSTSYNSEPKSLLASHLADKMIRAVRQRPATDQDASKGWIMRTDGRLVACQIIKNQEITGFCEWIAAASGKVRDVRIDGRNRLWMPVERPGSYTIERYDASIYLQDAVIRTCDLSGTVIDLVEYEDEELWAVPAGYSHGIGPFTVLGGAINLGDAYAGNIVVGRWQPPRFESMPEVLVTPNDDVVIRPGRIHTADINIIDTGSIAVGANGQAVQDIPLLTALDPVDTPMAAKTKKVTRTGMLGMMEYTTLVITQTKPGTFRVKDYAVGAKL